MLVVAGENIPYVREVVSTIEGVDEVRIVKKGEMTTEAVRDAELLLVRSTVQVNESMLAGTRVRFVATATIGTDHVDLDYLRSRGIEFASAPGSNARSVAEWVASALLVLESRGLVELEGATLGVVGVGNVGSRVVEVAKALGLKTLLNDPPRALRLAQDAGTELVEGARARAEGPQGFVSLDEVAADSDIVTFHVPLEKDGPDPTYHLLGGEFLSKLKPRAVVINTARGAVADTAALVEARGAKLGALAVDVWEGEPSVPRELFDVADIGTPHIAGHSFDGKVGGTRLIYEAACRFLGREPAWPDDLPPREDLKARLEKPSLLDAVRASYDIEADHEGLREILRRDSADERAAGFAEFRKDYRKRREFRNWEVELAEGAGSVEPTLRALGFRTSGE